MNRFIKIGQAAKLLGVTVQTLRRREKRGELLPAKISNGKTRYYDLNDIMGITSQESDLTIGYARVSSHDQKKDLKTQSELLSSYCSTKGWTFEVIEDLGSGMNYRKNKKLIEAAKALMD